MADYPASIFAQRELENLPGLVFDAAQKKNLFAEDMQNLAAEIVALERSFFGLFPRLLNPVYKQVCAVNLSHDDSDVYICPTGKKALFAGFFGQHNYSGSTISNRLYVKIGSTKYYVTGSLNVGNNAWTSAQRRVPILNAGEKLGVTINFDGFDLFAGVIEFDAETPVFSPFIHSCVSGYSDLYVPDAANYSLVLPGQFSHDAAALQVPVYNPTNGTIQCFVSLSLDGGDPADSIALGPAVSIPSKDVGLLSIQTSYLGVTGEQYLALHSDTAVASGLGAFLTVFVPPGN